MQHIIVLLDQLGSVTLFVFFCVMVTIVWNLRVQMAERRTLALLLGILLCLMGAYVVVLSPKEMEVQRIIGPLLLTGLGLLVMGSALTVSDGTPSLRKKLSSLEERLAIAQRAQEFCLAEMKALNLKKLSSAHKSMLENKMQVGMDKRLTRIQELQRRINELESRLQEMA